MFEIRFVDPAFAQTQEMRDKFPFVRSDCIFDFTETALNLCPAIRYLKKNSMQLSYGTLVGHRDENTRADVIVERKKVEQEIKQLCDTCKFKAQQTRE